MCKCQLEIDHPQQFESRPQDKSIPLSSKSLNIKHS